MHRLPTRSLLRRAFLVASSLLLAGCFAPAPRTPMPLALVETARVPGYPGIRAWGDEYTVGLEQGIVEKNRMLLAAAKAGKIPGGLDKAAFLSISGGGDEGAFTAGLLAGWTKLGTRPSFEVVTGVSTGALAAPFAFLGSDYDDVLRDIYTQTKAEDIYTYRGVFGFFQNAINGTAPLERLIRRYATDEFVGKIGAQFALGRRLLIVTTNLDAGRPVIWDMTAIAASDNPDKKNLLVNLLLASSAVPGVFPPVEIDVVAANGKHYKELHGDGGASAQMVFVPPQMKLVKIEQDVFGKVRDRTLYVLRNGKLAQEYDAVDERTLQLAERGVAILVKYQVIADLLALERLAAAEDLRFLYNVIPETFTLSYVTPFDPVYTNTLYKVGYDVGLGGKWSTATGTSPAPALP